MTTPVTPSSSHWDLALSPFASILGTNHAPSTKELAELKASLIVPKHELSRLDSEIARLQGILDGLSSALAQIKQYIDAHQFLMSPVRQIPPETLSEIFVWCLPSVDSDTYSVRSLDEAPLILTTICRDWRRIAIQTPRLWTSLHIYHPLNITAATFARRTKGVNLWLERSASLPISISLHSRTWPPFPRPESQTDNMHLLIRLLMTFSDKFSSLSLYIAPDDYAIFDRLSPPQGFPVLRSVELRDGNLRRGMYSGHVIEPGIISRLCSRVPLLKKFAIYHCINQGAQYVALAQSNQWVSLTDLTLSHGGFLEGLTPAHALRVLAQTPQLRSTDLTIQMIASSSFTESLQMVHLAFLKQMCLSFSLRNEPAPDAEGLQDIQNGVVRMFETIHCPSLTSLSFSLSGFPISEIPFTSLPLDNLDALELDAVMSSKALYHCLALVPSLLSLQIRDMGTKGLFLPYDTIVDIAGYNNTSTMDESVLLALSRSGAESDGTDMPLCPKLQNFRLFPSPSQKISSAALTTFITSRMKNLKLCEALFPSQDSFAITDEDLGRLKAVKESGMMNLRLHYSWDSPPPMDEQDLPTMGLSRHVHDPLPLMPRRRSGPSDMEGYWGTGIIV